MSTPGTVNYPTSLDDAVSLIDAGNLASSGLASDFNAGDATCHLTNASAFSTSGTFTIESEVVYFTGKSTNDLTGCLRGQETTANVTHTAASGAIAQELITARHHTVLRDAIIAAQTELGVGARMSPLFNQRSDTPNRAIVLPSSNDFGVTERLSVGSGGTVEIPSSSTLSIYDSPGIPAKILQGPVRNIVRDYGAVAWPDAAQTINQAISDVAAEGGGIVEVPMARTAQMSAGLSWSYFNCSQIRMKSNVWLRGVGPGMTPLYDGTPQLRATGNPDYMIVLDNTGVVNAFVSDLLLVGVGATGTGALHFDQTGGPTGGQHRVFRVYAFNFPGDGFRFSGGCQEMTCFDNYAQLCGGNGFWLDNLNGLISNDNHFIRCLAGQCGLGFYDQSSFNHWVDCKAFLCTGDGFRFASYANSVAIACEAQQNSGHGFNWLGGKWYKGTALVSDSNGGDGFHIDGATLSDIEGRVIELSPGVPVGHQNIVGFANSQGTPSQNKVDVEYDPSALLAGGQIVAGSYTNSDVHVRQFGARMNAALTLSLRSDTYGAMVIPQTSDYGVSERLIIGSSSSIELPGTSTLMISDSNRVPELPPAVDICAKFGVSTSNPDNSAAINTALATLGPQGLAALISIPGTYDIQNPIIIGNGNSSQVSTWSGVLMGAGYPPFSATSAVTSVPTTGVRLRWTGLGGAPTMVDVLGPLSGWGIFNLLLCTNENFANSPALGLRCTSAQFGEVRNFAIADGFAGGIRLTTVPAFGSYNTDTLHNTWTNIFIGWNGATGGPFPNGYYGGIWFDGTSTSNTDYNDFRQVLFTAPSTSSGQTHVFMYFGACDNVRLRGVHCIPNGGSDTKYGAVYDYSVSSVWPADCHLDDVDFGATTVLFKNVGTPVVSTTYAAPNRITNVSGTNGGPPNPGLANLDWQNTALSDEPEPELSLRSDTTGVLVVPKSADYGVSERLSIGASSTIEIPATSSITIYNVS